MSCTGKNVFLLWWHHSTYPPRVQFCLQNLPFWLRLLLKQHCIFSDVQPGLDDSYLTGLMRGKRREGKNYWPVWWIWVERAAASQQKLQFLIHPIQWGRRECHIHMLPELLLTFASMVKWKGTTEFLGYQGEVTLPFCCLEKQANEEDLLVVPTTFFTWAASLQLYQWNLVQFQVTSGLLAKMGICYIYLLKMLEDSQE